MAKSMVPTVSVVIVRDGKRVKPEIGKAFDFTKEEADSILETQPGALRKAAGDEDGTQDALDASKGSRGAKPSAEASQAGAKGGRKKATAAKSDAENAEDEGKEDGDESGDADVDADL